MKNKGFTMVELLSVIAILGILVTMAVAGVRGILNRTKESYLDGQNKMVVLAGKSYYADYQSHLPKVIGPIHEVTLETLVSLKYIDPVKDANGEDCVIAEGDKVSKVYVQKINEEEYKYSGYLYCNGEESGTNDTTPPTITISPMQTAVASKTALTVNIKVTDDIGVLSYRYVITKDGKEYKDTGYKNYKKQISIKLNENGKYKIKAYAYDTSGNRGSKESGEYEIKIAAANCNGITLTASPNSTAWQNKNISITLKRTDSSIESWTVKDSYYNNSSKKTTENVLMKRTAKGQKSFTLSDNGEHQIQIEAYNSAGGKCSKDLTKYKIDKVKPTKPTITNPTNGNWTNKNFSLTVTTTEAHSGVDYWEYSYDQKTWTKYADSAKSSFTTTPFSAERNQAVYIRVRDKAGNISDVASTMIRIDKTKPSKPSITNPSKGNWTNKNFSLTVKTTEKHSGVDYWEYSYNKSSWTKYASSSKTPFTTTAFSAERNQAAYIRVRDKAGNISDVASTTIRIDKTKPKCSPSKSNTYTKGGVTVKFSCSEQGSVKSGVSSCQKTKTSIKKSGSGSVKDKAGNSNTCGYSVSSAYGRYNACGTEKYKCGTKACGTTSKTCYAGTSDFHGITGAGAYDYCAGNCTGYTRAQCSNCYYKKDTSIPLGRRAYVKCSKTKYCTKYCTRNKNCTVYH